MLDLALSVLCSSLIFVIFKLFAVYKVNTLLAIIANYITACTCGILLNPTSMGVSEILEQPWLLMTMALGLLFILVFNIMAKSSQINGVGVTSVATKMSLVIPVLFAVLYYKDVLSLLQIVGILLALAAVYLASVPKKELSIKRNHLWLPLLVFLGSGIIDTSIKFIQEAHLNEEEYPIFSSIVFGSAAISGILFLSIRSFQTLLNLNFKSVLGGIVLGIPNYFSIFFLLRALNTKSLNSASVFTINNVAIVLFSTLLGIILFKEQLSRKNLMGVGLAIISIILVALF